MALIPEHQKYHDLSPKDVMKEGTPSASIDIARTTNATGEQLHISCPIFRDDSREELDNRINFCFSLIQDRMEAENKAINALNDISQRRRNADEAMKRNEKKYQSDLKQLKKSASREKWKHETLETKAKDLDSRYNQAQEQILGSLSDEDKEFLESRAGSTPMQPPQEVPPPQH